MFALPIWILVQFISLLEGQPTNRGKLQNTEYAAAVRKQLVPPTRGPLLAREISK